VVFEALTYHVNYYPYRCCPVGGDLDRNIYAFSVLTILVWKVEVLWLGWIGFRPAIELQTFKRDSVSTS
jgi:hypothetical protein